jgi:hypothetical protein
MLWMIRFLTRRTLSLLLAVSLLVIACVAHRRLDQRLSGDWADVVERARDEGLELAGKPAANLLTTGLAIEGVTLRDHAGALIAATDALRLSRGVLGAGRLAISLPDPVTLLGGLRVWASGLAFARAASGALELDASDAHLARRGGPDDVLSIASLRGRLDAGHLTLSVTGAILPLRSLSHADRTIGHATLEATTRPGSRLYAIDHLGADWNGVRAAATGQLSRDGSGALDGRLSVSLDGHWHEAVNRLLAAREITPDEAIATRAVLSLLDAPGALRDLPLAIDHGTVSFSGLPIVALPPM